MDNKYENLIRRITSVGLDIDSESPADIQVDGSTDGVLHFLEYDVDDEGYITTLPREYDGTFADAIQAAIDCDVKDLTIDGLSRDEAVELLGPEPVAPTPPMKPMKGPKSSIQIQKPGKKK